MNGKPWKPEEISTLSTMYKLNAPIKDILSSLPDRNIRSVRMMAWRLGLRKLESSNPVKICSSCGKALPASSFHKRNNGYANLAGRCKECVNKYNVEWYKTHSEEQREKTSRWRAGKRRDITAKCERKLRLEVLKRLSNPPKCSICGIDDIRILDIDHINGGGNEERRRFKNTHAYYLYLKNLPDEELKSGYQILCKNDNWLKQVKKHDTWGVFLDEHGHEKTGVTDT